MDFVILALVLVTLVLVFAAISLPIVLMAAKFNARMPMTLAELDANNATKPPDLDNRWPGYPKRKGE